MRRLRWRWQHIRARRYRAVAQALADAHPNDLNRQAARRAGALVDRLEAGRP